MKILYQGAESIIYEENDKLVKERIKKNYRHPSLDLMKRKYPTRKEFKLLTKLQNIINVPKAYKMDDNEMKIKMENLKGDLLKDKVSSFSTKERKEIFTNLGIEIAKLHTSNIIHGDLTTANLIIKENKIYFIDFGLGNFSEKAEDKAVDLRVLRQALESKHYEQPELFDLVIEGYSSENTKPVLERLNLVETRGRYKRKNHKSPKISSILS
tara:strand:- start:843 stop:1478 length:636 start_codon:yes stop_codon:yes gene_type:complete